MIRFNVPGTPVSKARPRVTKRGFSYTPKKTVMWENRVAFYGNLRRPKELIDGPIAMKLTFYFAKPKSRKKYNHPSCGKDVDNLAKSIMDPLQGIIYTNDSRIVDIIIRKRYAPEPSVDIEIHEM